MSRGNYKKLTDKDMLAMARLSVNDGLSHQDISDITGFPRRSVSHFLARKNANTEEFWTLWDASNGFEGLEDKDDPKIFIYDIETSPMLGYFWGLFKQNISIDMIKEDWFVMTWAGKWFGQEKILSDSCWNYGFDPKNKDRCDVEVIKSLWEIIDQADMIVAHNGNRFDIKKVTARAIILGLKPHKPVKLIDTMLIAKGCAAFSSNKLQYLAKVLCGESKMDTGGIDLWIDCLNGCEKAWEKMLAYNIQDVNILENVWVALAPYDKKSPSFITHSDSEITRCINPACGSHNVVENGSTHKTTVSEFVGYECNDCGKQMRGRKNIRSREQMDATLMHRV